MPKHEKKNPKVNKKKEDMENSETRHNVKFEDNSKASTSKGNEKKHKQKKKWVKDSQKLRSAIDKKKKDDLKEEQRQSTPSPVKRKSKKKK